MMATQLGPFISCSMHEYIHEVMLPYYIIIIDDMVIKVSHISGDGSRKVCVLHNVFCSEVSGDACEIENETREGR